MQVIGFNFTKISAERKKAPTGKIEVKSNMSIKKIEQEKIEFFKDQDVLRFDFSLPINYEPKIAEVMFEGSILVATDKKHVKEILKKWKSKKIPDEIRLPLLNLIFTKCNLKALQLEEDLSLPSHIPMPKLQKQQSNGNTNYTG